MTSSNWTINSTLNYNYKIDKIDGLFEIECDEIINLCPIKRAVIVIDEKVSALYMHKIQNYLNHHKIDHRIVTFDGVETEKNLDSLLLILREMEQFGVSRKNEPLIAIGGGVIQDVAGLAATIYRRGVPYIRVPTTLLGIIDVSVAAKTGINFEDRRNRLGSYYPPIAALLDKSFLKSLPEIEISSGLGEILKMGVIKDAKLFDILEKNGTKLLDTKFDCDFADETIDRSIQGMKEELENNLWEKNLKRIVDFGHSFSPIIEMRSLVDKSVVALTHGQAVTLDIIFSSILSVNRGLMTEINRDRIIATAKSMNLPTYHTSFSNPVLLFESLQDTVKHRNGDQNLPFPTVPGSSVFVNDLTYDEVIVGAKILQELHDKK